MAISGLISQYKDQLVRNEDLIKDLRVELIGEKADCLRVLIKGRIQYHGGMSAQLINTINDLKNVDV